MRVYVSECVSVCGGGGWGGVRGSRGMVASCFDGVAYLVFIRFASQQIPLLIQICLFNCVPCYMCDAWRTLLIHLFVKLTLPYG